MGAGLFQGYGRKEMPYVHIPKPQPQPGDVPVIEPAVLTVKDGVPVQYGDLLGIGVRMVHPANPRAPAENLGFSLYYVPPHVVQDPGSHETEETYVIIKGEGHMYLNGKRVAVKPSTWIWLPPWTEHGIENTGDETMEIMVLTSPPNP
jgi:mannose-6-phosphate isomerase-like protein (cupin superfamily)